MSFSPSQSLVFRPLIAQFLAEDLGLRGDLTAAALFDGTARSEVVFRVRESGVLAGGGIVSLVFDALTSHEQNVDVTTPLEDGARFCAGDIIARASGAQRVLLSGERVALNLLSRMCGVATLTRAFADKIAHTKARVTSTRKTTPGLRPFEKYAVTCGGGLNHRFGLYDGVMIKDNHIAFAGGVEAALDKVRARYGPMVQVVIEVDTLEQLEEALGAGAAHVLLDNMDVAMLASAVEMNAGRAHLEASGGVTLDSVQAIAETGVDTISVGALTHSAPLIDIGLDAV